MNASLAWVLLIAAGVLEVVWAIGLKQAEGFTRLAPSVVTVLAMVGSMVLLGMAARAIPIGTAYAVWVGVGVVGTAILGIVLFHEPATAFRLASVGLVLAGIVGLKLASPGA